MLNLIKDASGGYYESSLKINEDYKKEFIRDLVQINIKREKLLSIILIAVDLILLFIDAWVSDFWTADKHVFSKFSYYHIALLIIPLVFLLFVSIADNLEIKNLWFYRITHLSLISIVLISCTLIAAVNEINGNPISAYIVAVFCVACLIYLSGYEAYLIYISCLLLFIIRIGRAYFNTPYFSGDLIFIAVLISLAIVFSKINYASLLKSFLDKKTIVNQNGELQLANSILKAQQEASLDGILITDKYKKVLSYNNKFKSLWNIPDGILENNDDAKLFEFMLKSLEIKENVPPVEKLYFLPYEPVYEKVKLENGTVMDVYSVSILLKKGGDYGKVWFYRDVTEMEKANEALRRSAEENERLLKEALKYDEVKSEFFANISHEFRTPINVLLGALQLMNMKNLVSDAQAGRKTQKYARIMRQNCYRLLRLTNNLIDMTRLDMGFFEINLHNQNIIQIVEDITMSVAEYVEDKDIALIFDTDSEEKIIAVDVDKIERIMLNLLSNSVKFTKEKGTIKVNIRDLGESIEISVKDTGIGIPKDKQEIVFERFRQVDSSLSRANEGSGIGLSLTRNLVELHGGSIKIDSEINKGSEFVIELPCKTISEEDDRKPITYTGQNHLERISIEFSDIYSI